MLVTWKVFFPHFVLWVMGNYDWPTLDGVTQTINFFTLLKGAKTLKPPVIFGIT